MSLYEGIESDRLARPLGREPASSRISEAVRLGLVALLVGLWIAGAYGGIVYWALQESLLGVLGSALVSLAAGAATWPVFVAIGDPEGR